MGGHFKISLLWSGNIAAILREEEEKEYYLLFISPTVLFRCVGRVAQSV